MANIEHIPLPDSVQQCWERKRDEFYERAPRAEADWLREQLTSDPYFQGIKTVWGCSEYVANACIADPWMFRELVQAGDLERSFSPSDFAGQIETLVAGVEGEPGMMSALRMFRKRQMIRIIWRDFSRRFTTQPQTVLEETTHEMTWLAEVVLQCALDFFYTLLADTWGYPENASGERQHLIVLGMGKLGAWELNVSSDIDLIFAYPQAGQTRGGRRSCSNQEFFVRLGQKLIKSLDEHTHQGFVFRVDMRLRPYGKSGPLVMNFDALEEYYQTQGRDWERYAMIKARPVAGDMEAGAELLEVLRPFTYRKYIDYSAFESLRSMKEMINREVQRSGSQGDVKKGEGGIREAEFVVQAFQIVRGGRDRELQITPLKDVLERLRELQLLPAGDTEKLYQAYTFLRNTEHAIQGWNDQQTQSLPTDTPGMERVAFLMQCDGVESFLGVLESHRQQVRQLFGDVIVQKKESSDNLPDDSSLKLAETIWSLSPESESELEALGFDSPQDTLHVLKGLRSSSAVMAMPETTRVRLDKFMPLLLVACGERDNASETFKRSLSLVNAVVRRSAYLVLLVENQQALEKLVTLSSASSWIADTLAQYPALLDELLDSRTLFALPQREALADELRQQLLRIPEEDLEAQMETVRYFKQAHSLRVAACEVTGVLPLMQVSDYLTWLAEAILEHVLEIAWAQVVSRYGEPGAKSGEPPGMTIIGYGKLGGIELAHGSDLDLVFIHNANMQLMTSGEKSVDNATFFARLGQRIIHILTAQTASGDVYEVDMRLRPSGNSGLLVTHIDAFEKYQMQDAWIWEHQALVRARHVAGDPRLAKAFSTIRKRILGQHRDPDELRTKVLEMREKMRTHLGNKERDRFMVKHDEGGLVDIEFIVQYLVLKYASQHPSLASFTDNVRILEAAQSAGLLTEQMAQQLKDAYIRFRSIGHAQNLQGESGIISVSEAGETRQQVMAIWYQVFGQQATG